MALKQDQRAMLQLLLERGQSYEDISGILGIGENEVRSRARGALRELAGGQDPDKDVALTDFLLGQADPIGRADVVRHLQNDEEALALANDIVTQLALIAPNADLPDLPEARKRRAPKAAAAPSTEATRPAGEGPVAAVQGFFGKLSRRQLLIGAGGLGALLVLVVVLVATGVIGGGDDDSSASDGGNQTANRSEFPRTDLKPVGDLPGSGTATFAQSRGQAVLVINAKGLRPTPKGKHYVVWLYNSNKEALPLAREVVGKNRQMSGPALIPEQVLPLISQFKFIDISLESTKNRKVEHTTSVLRGGIPEAVRSATASLGQQGGQGAAPGGAAPGGAAPGGAQGGTPQLPPSGGGAQGGGGIPPAQPGAGR